VNKKREELRKTMEEHRYYRSYLLPEAMKRITEIQTMPLLHRSNFVLGCIRELVTEGHCQTDPIEKLDPIEHLFAVIVATMLMSGPLECYTEQAQQLLQNQHFLKVKELLGDIQMEVVVSNLITGTIYGFLNPVAYRIGEVIMPASAFAHAMSGKPEPGIVLVELYTVPDPDSTSVVISAEEILITEHKMAHFSLVKTGEFFKPYIEALPSEVAGLIVCRAVATIRTKDVGDAYLDRDKYSDLLCHWVASRERITKKYSRDTLPPRAAAKPDRAPLPKVPKAHGKKDSTYKKCKPKPSIHRKTTPINYGIRVGRKGGGDDDC
jgi:hypothetical protein